MAVPRWIWVCVTAVVGIGGTGSDGLAQTTPVAGITRAPGFQTEEIYRVPNEQGSWVSMTVDDQGRLIASDQYGGLYRITPAADQSTAEVEPIQVNAGRAQGLLYAFDALYVMSHPGDGQPGGLYRVTDQNQDDEFDQVELLRKIEGGGEHGPHAIILSPDGKSLYVCAGNHTQLPEIGGSRVPQNWDEDQVIPRMWDANGHAAGILAPGGWVCKTDPDGKSFELISIGYRNQYDIAFDPNGELFTYDADMEWDIGLPWYRPTRICHSVPGAEFGWRSGTGKWPVYWPDSLPPVVDVGPASPTGIVFGTGAAFPKKYQHALFAADWSYGVIYAIHLQPQGSSFGAEKEIFATAPGLAVTDMVINPKDGALYFLIGGRRSQSALFRVTYQGDVPTTAVAYPQPSALASERRELEELLKASTDQASEVVSKAMPALASGDRFIRYTARVALERMPISAWGAQALEASATQPLLEAIMAVARSKDADLAARGLERLLQIEWASMNRSQQLHWLRDAGLLHVRHPQVTAQRIQEMVAYLSPQFPAGEPTMDMELARLLCGLDAPSVVPQVLELMAGSQSQEEQIHYAYCLRVATHDWNADRRRQYYEWFVDAGKFRGGNSFSKFLINTRNEATERMSEAEKLALGELVNLPPRNVAPTIEMEQRPIVKKWELEELLPIAESSLQGRDLKNGAAMFAVGQCYKCHRVAGNGGSVGPDLTAAGRRFSPHDLLETLVVPSKEVSDQYQATLFQLEDGRTLSGRIANLSGNMYMVQTDMFDPGRFTNIKVEEILDMKPSTVSMMPTGLLDSMNRDDILDLLAYLRSVSEQAFEQN